MIRAVLCLGGPLDGQGFTADDWQTRHDAAKYMAERTDQRAPALGYKAGTTADLPGRLPKALRDAQPPYLVLPLLWKGYL